MTNIDSQWTTPPAAPPPAALPASVKRGVACYFVAAVAWLAVGMVILAGTVSRGADPADLGDLIGWGFALAMVAMPVVMFTLTWLVRAGNRGPHLYVSVVGWLCVCVNVGMVVASPRAASIIADRHAFEVVVALGVLCPAVVGVGFGGAGGVLLSTLSSQRWFANRNHA